MSRRRAVRGGARARAGNGRRSWTRWLWDGILTVAILGLLVLLAAKVDRIGTRELEGRAIVLDGDTITISGERIRLIGIDAPEYDQTCTRQGEAYPCGRRALEALGALAQGRVVSCSARGRDRYNRLLATCSAGGIELNRRLVESGWAVAYGDYEVEEAAARQRKAGLWAGDFDQPRDWRASHGGAMEPEHPSPGILDWLRCVLQLS